MSLGNAEPSMSSGAASNSGDNEDDDFEETKGEASDQCQDVGQ